MRRTHRVPHKAHGPGFSGIVLLSIGGMTMVERTKTRMLWYNKSMTKTVNIKGYTLGRKGFAKISAVEGIRLSREMEGQFSEFDKKGLSADERRAAIKQTYGRKG